MLSMTTSVATRQLVMWTEDMANSNDWMTQRLAQLGTANNTARADATPLDVGQLRYNGRVYDLYDDSQVQQLLQDSDGDDSPEASDAVGKAMTFAGFTPDGVESDNPNDYGVRPENRSVVMGKHSWLDKARDFGSQVVDDFKGATFAGMTALNNPETFRNGGRTIDTIKNSFAKNTGLYADLIQGALGKGVSSLAYGGNGKVPEALQFDDGMEKRIGAMFPAPKNADPVLAQAADFYADPLAVIPQARAAGAAVRDVATTAADVGRTALKSPQRAAEMLGDKWIEAGRLNDATQGVIEQTLGLPEGSMPRAGNAGRSNILYPMFDSQSQYHAPWMTDLVAQARALRAKGKTPEEVFKKTRTVLGADAPDGVTRVELDDKRMTVNEKVAKSLKRDQVIPMSKVINHPEFSAKDYNLGGMDTNQEMRFANDLGYGDSTIGELNIQPQGNYLFATGHLGKNVRKKTILHELQHKVDNDMMIADSGSNDMMATDSTYNAKSKSEYSRILREGNYNKLQEEMRKITYDNSIDGDTKRAMIAPLLSESENLLIAAEKAKNAVSINGDSELKHLLYLTNIGEANARLASARSNLSLSQRKSIYPYEPEYYKKMTGFYPDELWGSRASKEPVSASYGEVTPEGEALSPYGLRQTFPEAFNNRPYEQSNKGLPSYSMREADYKNKYGGLSFIAKTMMENENWEKIKPLVLQDNLMYSLDKTQPKYFDKIDLNKLRDNYAKILAENENLGAEISRKKHEAKRKFDKQSKSFSPLRENLE